ncbi:hypothetical protein BDR03DRAFT_1013688 [Suillus americanus]|nr:hypothetical protein BDR03DRAFT_1013688 [Suillus americanus]
MQVANGRSFEFMVKVALGIAKRWKWDIMMVRKLSDDLQAYNQSLAPFAGGHADGLSWWNNLPINSKIHPLKAFSVTILSIVGHAEVGIAVETAQDLEASFAWAPPLLTEPRNADYLLAGLESISPDDVAAEFAALEELKRTEEVHSMNEVEVLEGNAFNFDELDRVEQGIIPQTVLDEVEVVNYNGEGDSWDEATLMSSLGMSYT